MQNITGFIVGKQYEHGGIAKDGAKFVHAVANADVPKFTVVFGGSFGAGNYAMAGRAYDPRFLFMWPNAKISVMGGEQAAKVFAQIQVSSKEKRGEKLSDADKQELLERITGKYDKHTTAYYAGSRLWVDAIIDPLDTRKWISMGIEAANHAPITEDFKLGALQT